MNNIFNLSEAPALSAVLIRKIWPRSIHSMAIWIVGGAGIFFLILAVIIGEIFVSFFAWSLATFGVLLFFYGFIQHGFSYSGRIKLSEAIMRIKKGEDINLALFFDFYATRAVLNSGPLRNIPSIYSLTDQLLKEKRMKWVCMRLGLDANQVRKDLSAMPFVSDAGDLFFRTIKLAAHHAEHRNHKFIGILDLFSALAVENPNFKKYLFEHGIEPKDFDLIVHWQDHVQHIVDHRRRFWLRENLFRGEPIGKGWSGGFTPLLDAYSTDITQAVQTRGLNTRIIGRKKEIETIEQVLAKAGQNNVLLVGEAGVGRETILYGFAKRMLEGKSIEQLNRQKLIQLDLSSAIAGLKTIGEIDGRVKQLFSEAIHASNIILIIQNFHHFFGQSFADGVIDISRAIVPFIKSSHMQLIAITTHEGYHEKIEKLGELKDAFHVLEVQEPDIMSVRQILMDSIMQFEYKYKIFFPYASIKAIVDFSDRYIQNVPFPEKAVDLLEEVSVLASRNKKNIVTVDDVAAIVSSRTQVPVGSVQEEEKEKLLHLEDLIHQRIIDQEEAVSAIANAMRRARAGISNTSKRPIGSFLFLGPTGVGKTETAKALAHVYFGSDTRMVRFDMSEYNAPDSEQRLIGSPATREEGTLTTAVRENPFCLLLLDELEKANSKVLNLFLQVLDEGHLTDGWGRKVVFTHTIIIATSNAGAEYIREAIKQSKNREELSKGLIEYLLAQALFKPEFLNRFDGTIVFKPLEREHVVQIIKMLINNLSTQLYHEKGIKILADDNAINKLLELGFSQNFGGRELRRIVQENVEDEIAKKILSSELKHGDTFVLKSENLSR